METIEQLMAEEKELLKKLNENIEKQREIKIKPFCKKHGIYIGDTVESLDGIKGVVSGIHFYGKCSPRLYIVKQIKSEYNPGVIYWPSQLIKRANEK